MSIDSRATTYGKIFGDWTLHEMIGKGSNGKTAVFCVTRNNKTYKDSGAMKVINITEQRGKRESLSKEYLQEYDKQCEALCIEAENELNLMHLLGNSANIVNYHDHRFEEWEDEYSFGIDLLIRMDLLNSLEQLKRRRTLREEEIIKIGIDISKALICCHDKGVIHRDIKPDNIFYTEYDYMLGDFGISKMTEGLTTAETHIGTAAYAAPEQSFSNYDYRVDIYSLGLTMYELANGNKLPFAHSMFVRPDEMQLRLNGKPLPKPENASDELAKIILKACAYKPEDRYQKAEELKAALERLLKNGKTKETQKNEQSSQVSNVNKETVNHQSYETVAALGENETKAYETVAALGENETEDYETMASFENRENKTYDAVMDRQRKELEDIRLDYAVMAEVEKVLKDPGPLNSQHSTNVSISDEVPMLEFNTAAIDMLAVAHSYFEKGDYVKAVDWYQQAVAKGNMEAIYELANCYMTGLGVEKDSDVALNMFRVCVEKCEDSWIRGLAEFRIGQIYEEKGTRKERKIAEQWYRRSASDGNPYAMKRFHNGRFIKN